MITRTKQAVEDPETKRRRLQAEDRADKSRTDATQRDLQSLTDQLLRIFGRKSPLAALPAGFPGFTTPGTSPAPGVGGGYPPAPGGAPPAPTYGGGGGNSSGGSFDPGSVFYDPRQPGDYPEYDYLTP